MRVEMFVTPRFATSPAVTSDDNHQDVFLPADLEIVRDIDHLRGIYYR